MLLNIYLLLLNLISVQLAWANVFLDYQVDSSNMNIIFLECYDGGGIDPSRDAIFEFFNPITRVLQARLSPLPDNRLRYNVTSATEAVIHCFINNVSSQNLSIAAIPPSFEGRSHRTNVFRGTSTELTCPFELGNLRNTIDPYSISWEEGIEGGMFPIQLTDPDLLSPDNTMLTVSIEDSNDSRTFQCVFDLRRCENAMTPCPARRYRGPMEKFQIFEKSKLTVTPRLSPSVVAVGETAQFNCGGIGSYIRINWRFNDSLTCNNDSCEPEFLSYHEMKQVVDKNSNNLRIDSIMTIDTSRLFMHQQEFFDIECNVEQMMPSELNLPGETHTFVTNVRVDFTMITTSSTTQSTEIVTATPTPTLTARPATTSSPDPVPVVAVAVAVPVAIFVAIVIAVLAFILVALQLRHKRGKFTVQARDSPDIPVPNPGGRVKPPPVYEELPESRYIAGVECQHPLLRQNGIEYDPTNPKADNFSYRGSDDRSVGGSDLSGLSGVSGNIPGAHKMPTYSHDNSVVSDFLAPPSASWETKRYSDSTVNSRHTESTVLPFNCHHHPEYPYRHSATEVGQGSQPPCFFPNRPASYSNINYNTVNVNESLFLVGDGRNQAPMHGPSPSHSYTSNVSHPSSASSHRRRLESHNQHPITDGMLLTVVNCLMHNRDCEIPDCPCQQIQERYKHLRASSVPLQQIKSPEKKARNSNTLTSSSSTESDSDSNSKKLNMRLPLNGPDEKKLHPHYHITKKSHIRRTRASYNENHRRSRSLSDLTPITETRETPLATPMVGGAIIAGTPICHERCLGDSNDYGEEAAYTGPTKKDLLSDKPLSPLSKPLPPLLKEISISSDNLPVLCLNDCLLQLKTPSPNKCHGRSLGRGKPFRRLSSKLKTVRENSNGTESDDSNTSSRSDSSAEAAKSSQSDVGGGMDSSFTSHNNHLNQVSTLSSSKVESSLGYESLDGEMSSVVFSDNSRTNIQGYTSPSHQRSCSPFETETTVSHDGAVIQTTEC